MTRRAAAEIQAKAKLPESRDKFSVTKYGILMFEMGSDFQSAQASEYEERVVRGIVAALFVCFTLGAALAWKLKPCFY